MACGESSAAAEQPCGKVGRFSTSAWVVSAVFAPPAAAVVTGGGAADPAARGAIVHATGLMTDHVTGLGVATVAAAAVADVRGT